MSRELSVCLLALAYVAFAATQSVGGPLPLVLALALAAALTRLFGVTAVPAGSDRVQQTARRAARAVGFGVALFVVARSGSAGRPALDAAANFGVGVAEVGALIALARIAPLGGMLSAPKTTESLDAAAFAVVLWSIATVIPLAFALSPGRFLVDPRLTDYVTTSAAAGSLFLQIAASLRLRAFRRVELGVGDRAAGALSLSISCALVAVLGASLGLAPPDRFLPALCCLGAALATWAAVASEPTRITQALRGILAVAILGVPVTIAAGVLGHRYPDASGTILIAVSAGCVVVGLVARAVARPLGPEQSRWLNAIEAANRGALSPEPDLALTAALVALQKTAAEGNARAEIWRSDPTEMLTVDVAGYLHVEGAEAPANLYELALAEPERTLRADALSAVEVRRPEVRGLLAWFRARNAYSATVVCDADGPLGFVLLPRESRSTPLTLEEARAVRLLSDRISSLLAVSSALSRAQGRELQAEQRNAMLQAECQRLTAMLQATAARHELPAEREAEHVRRAAYSPAARITLDQLVRLAKSEGPIALVAPVGVDPRGFGAHAHLASSRARGPFVVTDGAEPKERELANFSDPSRSPLVLADSGTLLVRNASALPQEVQAYLAHVLQGRAEHAASSSSSALLPAALQLGLPAPSAELVRAGRLHPELCRFLVERELALPGLLQRSEDLRALVLETLSRLGLAGSGEPLGIEPAALATLTEYGFPGNEIELQGLLARAAAQAKGPRLRAADLWAAGLPNEGPELRVTPLEQAEDEFEPKLPSLSQRRRALGRRKG